MFTQWLRTNKYVAGVLTILRVYLGWEFLSAGFEKLTSSTPFSAAGYLQNSVQHPVLGPDKHVLYPWFNSFVSGFALPHVGLFNFLVPWGEFLVGVGLILGVLTTMAAFFGVLMNLMYMFAGTVSSNPLDLLLGMFILVAGYNAGYFGGDHWLIPYVRRVMKKIFHAEVNVGFGAKLRH